VALDCGPDCVDDAGIECQQGVSCYFEVKDLKYEYFKYGYFKQEGVG